MPSIADLIREQAVAYGLDPQTMLRIGQIESGLNPQAASPVSSARGIYQFLTKPGGSWSEYGAGKDPLDPASNVDAGMRYTRDNVAHLRSVLGREPTPGEVYLAHQQGRSGAAALLQSPQASAVDVLVSLYRGNRHLATQAVVNNGGRPDMTAGDFASMWSRKMGSGPAPAQPPTAMSVANPPRPTPESGITSAFTTPGVTFSAPLTPTPDFNQTVGERGPAELPEPSYDPAFEPRAHTRQWLGRRFSLA